MSHSTVRVTERDSSHVSSKSMIKGESPAEWRPRRTRSAFGSGRRASSLRVRDTEALNVHILIPRLSVFQSEYNYHPHLHQPELCVWVSVSLSADLLLHDPSLTEGRRLIELGAGVGLAGLVAADCTNAASVVITDGDQEVVKYIRHNVEATLGDGGELSVQLISFSLFTWIVNYMSRFTACTAAAPVEVRGLDWTTTEAQAALLRMVTETPSTVVAADVCYESGIIEGLADALYGIISCPDLVVIVATTLRNERTYSFFLDCLAKRGLAPLPLVLPERRGSPFALERSAGEVRLCRIVPLKS